MQTRLRVGTGLPGAVPEGLCEMGISKAGMPCQPCAGTSEWQVTWGCCEPPVPERDQSEPESHQLVQPSTDSDWTWPRSLQYVRSEALWGCAWASKGLIKYSVEGLWVVVFFKASFISFLSLPSPLPPSHEPPRAELPGRLNSMVCASACGSWRRGWVVNSHQRGCSTSKMQKGVITALAEPPSQTV